MSFSSATTLGPSGQVVSTGTLTTPREFHTATLLQNGKVLITGGNVFTSLSDLASVHRKRRTLRSCYGAIHGHWRQRMSAARTGHTASLLLDGRVLIFGGTSGTPSAEIYDPVTGTFAGVPSPSSSRSGHTATVLPSGKILFVGGRNSSGTLGTAEIYDPATNSFRAVGSMAEQRTKHTATLLTNGKVLVTGGGVGSDTGFGVTQDTYPQQTFESPSPTAELFDPQTETFSAAGNMNTGRSDHTATLLPDGTVLLFGGSHGWSGGYTSDNTAEIYDPATGSF